MRKSTSSSLTRPLFLEREVRARSVPQDLENVRQVMLDAVWYGQAQAAYHLPPSCGKNRAGIRSTGRPASTAGEKRIESDPIGSMHPQDGLPGGMVQHRVQGYSCVRSHIQRNQSKGKPPGNSRKCITPGQQMTPDQHQPVLYRRRAPASAQSVGILINRSRRAPRMAPALTGAYGQGPPAFPLPSSP